MEVLTAIMTVRKTSSLHARPLQVLHCPEPGVGSAAACPVSTERPGGAHSQSLRWGALGYQTTLPPGSLTSPPGLHSNTQDPVVQRERNLQRKVLATCVSNCTGSSPRSVFTCSVMGRCLACCSFWYNMGLGCTAPVSK